MSTISGNLALLQRTKAGQRALLEEMYPDIDFSTVPFREYGRLFTGRKYVPGFVGGWNAYGRSNTDADRDVLYDYSGHGRDIRLYNFGFSGMSGYGGYAQDFSNVKQNTDTGLILEQDSTHVKIQNVNSGTGQFVASMDKSLWNNTSFSLNVTGADSQTRLVIRNTDLSYSKTIRLSEGLNIVEPLTDDEWQPVDIIYLAISVGATVTFELLPLYPGGLVSDGVDDYGQCVKGFALPDDYTVVAIRKPISANNAAFTSKGRTTGAFLFEAGSANYSYGQSNNVGKNIPALFSYMSKNSYNGKTIESGIEADTEDDVFDVFRHNSSTYNQSVLYDLRIYDHTLTDEELQAVKDEMMSDYGEATGGGISDIHYVCDFDAKGRSNDEEEPMRSQWIDKAAGKVIDLHNYAFAGMSGWGGYGEDFKSYSMIESAPYMPGIVTVDSRTIHVKGSFASGYNRAGIAIRKVTEGIQKRFFMKVQGLAAGQRVYIVDETVSPGVSYITETDGVMDVEITTGAGGRGNLFVYAQSSGQSDDEAIDVTIEQLPLYPGALVSDGVDDYMEGKDGQYGEVGSMLIHWKNTGLPDGHYIFTSDADDPGRLYCWNSGSIIACGNPHMYMDGKDLMVYTRTPTEVETPIRNKPGDNPCPLYRIIFIKEQLNDQQVEFLKWKVEKEWRDWCKANGYEYAINQLTE